MTNDLNYRVKIDWRILLILVSVFFIFIVIDFIGILKNAFVLSLIPLFLILNTFLKYFLKQVVEVSIVKDQSVILKKYSNLSLEEKEIKLSILRYSFREKISYPNKFYELYFWIEGEGIQINSTNDFISFDKKDISELISMLEDLNVFKKEGV